MSTAQPDPRFRVPHWARVLDALVVVLVVVACSAALTDGFRLRLGVVRLSFTTPWPALLWAAGLAALRHWRLRAPSLPARLAAGLRRARGDEALRAVVPLAVASRLAVLFVGLYATLTFGFPQSPPPFRVSHHELVNLPARWDAGWYLAIAQSGYYWRPGLEGQSTVAFFPAFPMLVRGVAQLAGRSPAAVLWTGVVVSMVAFVWGLTYVYRLAREHPALGSSRQAAAAVLLLASYPFAVFYGAFYTEGLFLLASAGAFYAATHRRWTTVAAWGLLAGLTRPNGVFLAPVVGLLVLTQWQGDRRLNRADTADLVWGLAAASAPAVGLALHAVFIWSLTGNPLQWAAAHAYWDRTFTGWDWIARPASRVAEHGVFVHFRDARPESLNLLAAVFALALAIPVARRLGLAYGALVLINAAVPLARGGELSMGRMTAVMFPIFLWLAAALPERYRGALVTLFAVGQGLMAVLFYTWRPPF